MHFFHTNSLEKNMQKIMVQRNTLMVLLVSWFLVCGHNLITGFKLLVKEDKILETQLKYLNKHVVATIQTKYGESYDCVDFYQQPAFDHPLLRDHKYEYKMINSHDQQNDKFDNNHFDIWLNGKGCPTNTVPIKRVTKEELAKINIATRLAHRNSINENLGVQVAVLRTSVKKKYYGSAMTTAVYHPVVQNMQYSSSRIVVRNGDDSIAVGWTTKDSHCYNTYCPGFVITTSKVPLDLLLKPYTVIGEEDYVYEKSFYIAKDVETGDWVFVLQRNNITMGYWPKKIFTNLADSADYIDWGGEVYSPPGTTPPPMGFGHLPGRGLYYDCYGNSIILINDNYEIEHNPSSCTLYHTSERYNIIDVGYVLPTGRTIFYGGP
ncbi:hypothetical protein LINPERPRIM_LOCUS31710 [Linum perenne]